MFCGDLIKLWIDRLAKERRDDGHLPADYTNDVILDPRYKSSFEYTKFHPVSQSLYPVERVRNVLVCEKNKNMIFAFGDSDLCNKYMNKIHDCNKNRNFNRVNRLPDKIISLAKSPRR